MLGNMHKLDNHSMLFRLIALFCVLSIPSDMDKCKSYKGKVITQRLDERPGGSH